MPRARHDWRADATGGERLFDGDGHVIAEVYPQQRGPFHGFGYSVWGYRGFFHYESPRDAKIRCGEIVLERQREPEPPTPVEQWNSLFD